MADSKAKRKRKHAVRNGKLDPAIKRGEPIPVARRTKTKKEAVANEENKHKGRWSE
jgi:hypothetical protein